MTSEASVDDIEYVLKALDQALAMAPEARQLLVNMADVERIGKRPSEALATVDRFLAESPDDLGALATKAYALIDLRSYPEAVAIADKMIERDPGYPPGRYARAIALHSLNRTREALDEIDEPLAALPEDVFGQTLRALFLQNLGRHEAAIAAANDILNKDPQESQAHALIAAAQLRLDPPLLRDAIAHLRTAVDLDPGWLPYQNELADALSTCGEDEEASSICEAVITRVAAERMRDPESIWSAGWAAYELGRYEEAINWLREACLLNPWALVARFSLAVALLAGGYPELAVDEYEGAISAVGN